MPLLTIETNQDLQAQAQRDLLRAASALVATQLGKPENYVMVKVERNPGMLFAGTSEPLAYLELKSIGLPQASTAALSAALCELVETHLKVPPSRTYIEFADAPRKMWGWNGGTF